MKIIEIVALENGAHNNQTINGADPEKFPVPDGWAIIHEDDGPHENFPFGSFKTEVVVDRIYMKRNSWTPGEIPVPEVVPEPVAPTEDDQPVTWKELDAAYQEGVDSVE